MEETVENKSFIWVSHVKINSLLFLNELNFSVFVYIGLYHQHLESLNTTSKDILMGIVAMTLGKIQTDPPLGECTRMMDRADQGILVMKIRSTDFINIDHSLQTQEAL